jgi:transposase
MSRTSRVERYAAIRRDARAGMSGRELQRRHGVGWRTVQAALESAWPAQRAPYPARASKLDPFKPFIDEVLAADLYAPRKQRHTVTRIFDRLRSEHGMTDVSYPVVRAYVAKRRPEIRVEHGRTDAAVFVPQTHLPGREAEVDLARSGRAAAQTPVRCPPFRR